MRLFSAALILLFALPTGAHAGNVTEGSDYIMSMPCDTVPVIDTAGHHGGGAVVPNGPAKDVPDPKATDTVASTDPSSVLSPLLAYNFSSGNSSLSNLTPVINYGWNKNVGSFLAGACMIGVNPYSAGQISVKDSSAFLPALMLPGIAGINVNMLLSYGKGDVKFLWLPVNLGLKLNTNFTDSNKTILQHNLRTAIGFKYANLFMVGIQYTWAWHNLTSESEQTFKKVFNTQKTSIGYLTVSLRTVLNSDSKSPSELYLEWRCVTDKGDYQGLPNAQILTLGFRKDVKLNPFSIAPAAGHR